MITFKKNTYSDKQVATFLSLVAGLFLFGAVTVSGALSYRFITFIFLLLTPFLGWFCMVLVEKVSKKYFIFLRIAKFSLIGGTSSLLELFILNSLFASTGITSGLYYSLFKAITFLIALMHSYFWNRHWTFERDYGANKKEFISFFLVNLIGLCINVGTASFLVNGIGAPALVSSYAWANIGVLVAVCITMIWNYLAYAFFVFKKTE